MKAIAAVLLFASALAAQTKDAAPRELAGGTTLPATCTTKQIFFKTDAPAGTNLYECTATNTWTQQYTEGAIYIKGNGSTDNTAAVNAAAASFGATGGTIILEDGVIDDHISFTAPTTLKLRNILRLSVAIMLRARSTLEGDYGSQYGGAYNGSGAVIRPDGVVYCTTIPRTATGTSGTNTLTVSSATGLTVGSYISAAGATGFYKITVIVGTTLTLGSNLQGAVSSGKLVCETPGSISITQVGAQIKNIRIDGPSTAPPIYINGGTQVAAQANIENVDIQGCVPITINGGFEITVSKAILNPFSGCHSLHITGDTDPFFNSNLITISDSILYTKGVLIDNNNASNLAFREIVTENLVGSFIEVDSTYGFGVGAIEIRGLSTADSGVGDVPYVIEEIGADPKGIFSVSLINTYQISREIEWSNVSINGLTIAGSVVTPQLYGTFAAPQQRYAQTLGGLVDAELASATTQFPTLAPFASLAVNQDASTWTPDGGGSLAVTLGPDGTSTAGKISCPGAQCAAVVFSASQALSVGDWIITGLWARSDDATKSVNVYPYATLVQLATATWDNGTSSIRPFGALSILKGSKWGPITEAHKISAVAASPSVITFALGSTLNQDISYWMPFLIRIPAGTMTDDAVIQYTRFLKSYQSGMPAGGGIISLLAHQQLFFGSDTALARTATSTLKVTDGSTGTGTTVTKLPTSCSGLVAGVVYNNSGTPAFCP